MYILSVESLEIIKTKSDYTHQSLAQEKCMLNDFIQKINNKEVVSGSKEIEGKIEQ